MPEGTGIPFKTAKKCMETGRAQILILGSNGKKVFFARCLDMMDKTKKDWQRCPYRKHDEFLKIDLCPCDLDEEKICSLDSMKQNIFNKQQSH